MRIRISLLVNINKLVIVIMDLSVYIFDIIVDIFIVFTIFAIYLFILFRYFIHEFDLCFNHKTKPENISWPPGELNAVLPLRI